MSTPNIGEVVSKEQFNTLYSGSKIGTTIPKEQFQKQYGGTSVAETTKTSAQLSAEKFKPTFAATGKESVVTAPLKTVGNIPSSAIQFVKGVVNFLNPITTVKTAVELGKEIAGGMAEMGGKKLAVETLKQIPTTTYEIGVPTFIKNLISGDIEEAQKTIINDPVGQIAPFIILGRAVAGKAGKGAEFDSAMKNLAKPVTMPAKYVGEQVGKKISAIGSSALGVSTGVGPKPIKEAFVSGKQGIKGTPFSEAIRGKTTEEEIVRMSIDSIEKLAGERSTKYTSQLEKIGLNKKVIDDTSIKTELQTQLNKFRVSVDKKGNLDFSKSPLRNTPEAVSDITTIYEDISRLGTKDGLEKTALGLDSLKKGIDTLYSPTGKARAFVLGMKSSIDNLIKKEVPGYSEMTTEYSKTSNLLKDLKGSLSIGGKQGTETAFNKLTQALRTDNNFRIDLINQLEQIGQNELTQRIAGVTMQPLAAKGLVGRQAQIGVVGSVMVGLLSPKILFGLLTTSPRIAGEFIQALGFATAKTSALINLINELRIPLISVIGSKNEK